MGWSVGQPLWFHLLPSGERHALSRASAYLMAEIEHHGQSELAEILLYLIRRIGVQQTQIEALEANRMEVIEMSIEDTIVDGIADALKAHVPSAVATALEGSATSEDDPTAKALLMLFADFARTEGVAGISALAGSVKKAFDSPDPADIVALAAKHDALYMSNLVDALQSAESEDRVRCSALAVSLGKLLGTVGDVAIGTVLKGALGGGR